MPKISIIVPVYKVEQYIRRCLDSILTQIFTDWECLLIDDGSPDNSSMICDEYSEKDSRFRVFHKENGGVSSARNLGLDNAKGEWVCFVDSDDWISEQYVSNLVNGLIDDVEMVFTNTLVHGRRIAHNVFLRNFDYIQYMIDNKLFDISVPWSKLFNMNILNKNNIRFPLNINIGEDGIFISNYLCHVNTVSFLNCSDYNYFIENMGSLSSKYYSFESEYEAFKIWRFTNLCLFNLYYSRDEALRLTWDNKISVHFSRTLKSVYRFKPHYCFSDQIKYLKSIDREYINEYSLYYNPDKMKRKMFKWLICNKLYFIYCTIGFLDRFKR